MRVLVTGATGFIGSAVARELITRGHQVCGLVRSVERAEHLVTFGVQLALGDMRRPESYAPLVRQTDAVIHAAQEPLIGRVTRRKAYAMHASDALMTRVLATECRDQGALFVYTSGALAHAAHGNQPVTGATPTSPCLLARGHAQMVNELLTTSHATKLRAVVVTPGMVYGTGGLLRQTVDMLRRQRYRVIGSGTNYWSFVHVDDLAVSYVLAVERGQPGCNYMVGDDRPATLRAFVDQLCRALSLPRVGHVPRWLVGLMVGFPMVEAACASVRIDNLPVKQSLGWVPRYATLDQGLPAALASMSAATRED